MLGLLALLFEVVDLQIQSLNLFPHLSFAQLKTLDLGIAGALGWGQAPNLSAPPIALASLGADLAVERPPCRIDHRDRIRNELGSILHQTGYTKKLHLATEAQILSFS